MSTHHPVFSRFRSYSGPVAPFTDIDFLGTTYRHEYVSGIITPRPVATYFEDHFPPFDEEYFEWIAVLESAVEARGSYVMMELGAGFGRWVVRGGFAARYLHPGIPFHLVAVEAEPVVYGWMQRHFKENGLDPAQHSLIHGAVIESGGTVPFYIGGPRGGPNDKKPEAWYGQFLTKDYDIAGGGKPDGEYSGFPVIEHKSGWRSIHVPGISLASLLAKHRRVDLIDMDLEGQELRSVSANIKTLDAKVRRLHIGTHSAAIETELRRLLSKHKWECRADYPLFSKSRTPFGEISFENGAQTWVNPRLA